MTEERTEQWRRQKALFQKALECDERERQALLDEARRKDEALAAEVEAMLGAHAKSGVFLDAPLTPIDKLIAGAEAPEVKLDPLLGLLLDAKYRIEARLGRGGMGAVYRATHVGTERPVAVKIIAPEFMSKPEFVERFKREAKAAGRLIHPNVVNVTDFGLTATRNGQLAYLVMEYLSGLTLGELLAKEQRLDLELSLDILEQAGLAVDEAHAQGIIHRDLKPENIWLQPNGRGGYHVKVLDFGLATMRDIPEQEVSSREPRPTSAIANATRFDSHHPSFEGKGMPDYLSVTEDPPPADEAETRRFVRTQTPAEIDPATVPPGLSRIGMIMGTPAYMSPEQCRGARLDGTSDVYALGVIAYQMLTGETPFRGDAVQLLVKHSEMPPPAVRERWRAVPKPVETVMMSALAKTPADRPPTPGAFAAALRTASVDEARFEREAVEIARRHRVAFALILGLAHAPFLVVSALLVSPFESGIPGVSALAWIASTLVLLASLDVGAAACALAAEQLRNTPNRRPRVAPILKRLCARARPALATILRGYFRPKALFAGLVAVVEETEGAQAVARSRILASRVRHLIAPVYAGTLATAIITLVGSALIAALAYFISNDVLRFSLGALLAFLTLMFNAVTVSGLVNGELARALLFDAARQANGECVPRPVTR